jgi:hypothetical protein
MRRASAKRTVTEKTKSVDLTRPRQVNPTQTQDPPHDVPPASAFAFGHDFSRIPVHRNASTGVQAKRTSTPRATGEQESEDNAPHQDRARELASKGITDPAGPMPHLETIQQSFGHHDVSGVQAHTGAQAVAASRALNAIGYTTGNHVAFPGFPGLHTAAHEAAHVVQQRAGVRLLEGAGQVGDRYEQHADAVAEQVVRGRSSEDLLGKYGGAGVDTQPPIQRQVQPETTFKSLGHGVKETPDADPVVITRPEQVLYTYGMTCYGTSVMYMIQSYGLIPPNMSRQEFEFAFTPLNPEAEAPHTAAKTGNIKVNKVEKPGAKPVDLITRALQGTPSPNKAKTSVGYVTSTEATLRGAEKGSYTVATIMEHMPAILREFQQQSEKPEYKFMKSLPASGTAYAAAKGGEKWEDGSKQLNEGTIESSYFKAGNTILTGVDYTYPPLNPLGHWVVIVGEKEKSLTINGSLHYLYPADDPLWGQVYVMAPLLASATEKGLKAADLNIEKDHLTHNGLRIHMLTTQHAYRRKGA